MKNFTIDFTGSCVIAAEDEAAALRTFWELINNQQPLPMNLYEVQNVDEEIQSLLYCCGFINAPFVRHKARSKRQLKKIAQKKLRKALDKFLIS